MTRIKCNAPGCQESHADHRWGNIKAQGEGWFHQKNGLSWCPQHLPDWVSTWRVERNK